MSSLRICHYIKYISSSFYSFFLFRKYHIVRFHTPPPSPRPWPLKNMSLVNSASAAEWVSVLHFIFTGFCAIWPPAISLASPSSTSPHSLYSSHTGLFVLQNAHQAYFRLETLVGDAILSHDMAFFHLQTFAQVSASLWHLPWLHYLKHQHNVTPEFTLSPLPSFAYYLFHTYLPIVCFSHWKVSWTRIWIFTCFVHWYIHTTPITVPGTK